MRSREQYLRALVLLLDVHDIDFDAVARLEALGLYLLRNRDSALCPSERDQHRAVVDPLDLTRHYCSLLLDELVV